MFNENSFLVQLYVKKINEETITLDEVPRLFNLRDVVERIINQEV